MNLSEDNYFSSGNDPFKIEAVSKPRIRYESKAQADEKAQHTREYVSILKRFATQLSCLRRGFEMASKYYRLKADRLKTFNDFGLQIFYISLFTLCICASDPQEVRPPNNMADAFFALTLLHSYGLRLAFSSSCAHACIFLLLFILKEALSCQVVDGI